MAATEPTSSEAPFRQDAPNVLVIVQDTQRADRLSQDGYGKPTTPNLDRLARRGLGRHARQQCDDGQQGEQPSR